VLNPRSTGSLSQRGACSVQRFASNATLAARISNHKQTLQAEIRAAACKTPSRQN
jgi:hypothetical protein